MRLPTSGSGSPRPEFNRRVSITTRRGDSCAAYTWLMALAARILLSIDIGWQALVETVGELNQACRYAHISVYLVAEISSAACLRTRGTLSLQSHGELIAARRW
jgi:hypothetical protein